MIRETALPGVFQIDPRIHGDSRGHFFEAFRASEFAAAGLPDRFVQDNVSFSQHGVLRGLHFQHPNAQGKLVAAIRGEVFDVAVDVRLNSPMFGRWFGTHLSDENRRMLYIPPGFAHGFLVLSQDATFAYKCTDYYAPAAERSLRWDDPAIAIDWPLRDVAVSAKDAAAPTLDTIDRGALPSRS